MLSNQKKYKLFLFIWLIPLLLSLVFFDAFIYDVLMYHGPFSVIATKLPGLFEFPLEEGLADRFKGFPFLWRFALYPAFLFDMPRMMLLPNLLVLGLFSFVLQKLKLLPWFVTPALTLVYPVCLFAFRSGYQDFFVGVTISISLLLMVSSVFDQNLFGIILSIVSAALASYTKYQGLLQSFIVLIVGILSLIYMNRVAYCNSKFKKRCLILIVLGCIVVGAHSIYNLFAYENPFYPISVGPFWGPESNYKSSPMYMNFAYPIHGFLNHFFSSTELDWVFRGVVPNYSIDMARSQTQYGGILDTAIETGFVRTGGSFAPAYVFFSLAFASGIIQKVLKLSRDIALTRIDFIHLHASLYVLFASFLPQSHELRYYLSIHILVAVLAFVYLLECEQYLLLLISLLFFMSVSMGLNFTQPIHSTITKGLSYAINYPSRDLPSKDFCLKSIQIKDPADRFGCYLILSK